jgi:hypothetical protein
LSQIRAGRTFLVSSRARNRNFYAQRGTLSINCQPGSESNWALAAPVSVVSADESGCVAIRFSRQQREENRLAPSLSMLKPHGKEFAAQTFAVDPVSSSRLWANMLPP